MKSPAIHLPSYSAQRELARGLWALGFRFAYVAAPTLDQAWLDHAGLEADAENDHLILQSGEYISVAYGEWVTIYHANQYLFMNSPRQFLTYARAFVPNAQNQETI